MLIGAFTHGVDPKGRVFIPAKWRDDLGTKIIITRGILKNSKARCLFGMSADGWEAFASRFSSMPETDVVGQAFRRMMFSNAADCDTDKQGRILIPADLREYANLDKEVKLVGVDNRIEIWNKEDLMLHDKSMEEDYDSVLARLSESGI